MAKILAVALVALLAYGCAQSQLSRSGIEGYDTRSAAERQQPRKTLLRPETRAALEALPGHMEAAAARAERMQARAERMQREAKAP